MRKCLDTDALLTIGEALDWDVSDGVRHLAECDDCRAQLEAMRLARDALLESEAIDSAALDGVVRAIRTAARMERAQSRRRERWLAAIEPVAAGLAALIILVSSGIGIPTITAGVLGFALGAALVIGGKAIVRAVPARGYSDR